MESESGTEKNEMKKTITKRDKTSNRYHEEGRDEEGRETETGNETNRNKLSSFPNPHRESRVILPLPLPPYPHLHHPPLVVVVPSLQRCWRVRP